jgi:hypothetical protein
MEGEDFTKLRLCKDLWGITKQIDVQTSEKESEEGYNDDSLLIFNLQSPCS